MTYESQLAAIQKRRGEISKELEQEGYTQQRVRIGSRYVYRNVPTPRREELEQELRSLNEQEKSIKSTQEHWERAAARREERVESRSESVEKLRDLREEAAEQGSGSPADVRYLQARAEHEKQYGTLGDYTPIAYKTEYKPAEERLKGVTEGVPYDVPSTAKVTPGFLKQLNIKPEGPREDFLKDIAERQKKTQAQFEIQKKEYALKVAEIHRASLESKQKAKIPEPVSKPKLGTYEATDLSFIQKVEGYTQRLQQESALASSPFEKQGKFALATAISVPMGAYRLVDTIVHPVRTVKGVAYSVTHPFETGAAFKQQIDYNPAGLIGETIGYVGTTRLISLGVGKLVSKTTKLKVSGTKTETRRISTPDKIVDATQQDIQIVAGKKTYSFSGAVVETYKPTAKPNVFLSKGKVEIIQTQGGTAMIKADTVGLTKVSEGIAASSKLAKTTTTTGSKVKAGQLVIYSKQISEVEKGFIKSKDAAFIFETSKKQPISQAKPLSVQAGKTVEILKTEKGGVTYQIFKGANVGADKSYIESIAAYKKTEIPKIRQIALSRIVGGGAEATETTMTLGVSKTAELTPLTKTVVKTQIATSTAAQLKPLSLTAVTLVTDLKARNIPTTTTTEKTKELVKTKEKTLPVAPSIISREVQEEKALPEQRYISPSIIKEEVKTKALTRVISQQKQQQEPRTVTEQITKIIEEPITKQTAAASSIPITIPSYPPPLVAIQSSVTRPPIIPSRPKERIASSLFSVMVRRRGRFESVGIVSDIKQAFAQGIRTVKHTAAASFKIDVIEGQNKVESQAIKFLPREFRKSKREKGVFVEKRKHRISTPGEKREITFKGIAALRSRNKAIRWRL